MPVSHQHFTGIVEDVLGDLMRGGLITVSDLSRALQAEENKIKIKQAMREASNYLKALNELDP
jgi:hypothetical protein